MGTAAVSAQSEAEVMGGNVYDQDSELRGQLAGLGVIVIHVKPALFPMFVQETEEVPGTPTSATSSTNAATHGDTLGADEEEEQVQVEPKLDLRTAPQKILDELCQEEESAGLGVRFVMAEKGMRIEC